MKHDEQVITDIILETRDIRERMKKYGEFCDFSARSKMDIYNHYTCTSLYHDSMKRETKLLVK
jgi:hypothetical protein